jgi:thioredoxin 1
MEKDKLLKKEKVILDFYATWCGPCNALSPIIEEVSKETNTELIKINIEENSDLAEQFGIMSLPTVLIIKKGKIVNEFIGLRQKEMYLKALI